MMLRLIIISLTYILLYGVSVAEEKAATDPTPHALKGFIKYHYLVVGGGLTKGDFYRAKIRIFDKAGTLMIERTEGKLTETVELVIGKEEENLTTWSAKFPKMGVNVSYLLQFYHDNFPLLTGDVLRKDSAYKVVVEIAYPDFAGFSNAEDDEE